MTAEQHRLWQEYEALMQKEALQDRELLQELTKDALDFLYETQQD